MAAAAVLDARALLKVLNALKRGDLTQRMPAELPGLPGKVAEALNQVIDTTQLQLDGLEELRGAVVREGRLQQRLTVGPVKGAWARQVECVNDVVAQLSQPTVDLGRVISAVSRGDLTQTMPLEQDGKPLRGDLLKAAEVVNRTVEQLASFAGEVTRVARQVGSEGRLGVKAEVAGAEGTWRELTEGVNSMARSLTIQLRSVSDVTTAVARGDLTKKISVEAKGELLELKNTINTMVDQLGTFASEVTRVAREVGTEGKLGGQAVVKGVAGTWKELTDSVNSMARNLTSQVRNIAQVTTAVANGDLSKQITVDAQGEILELKDTINTMVDQLGTFASEVTRVAREVGSEGKLGGQAEVRGAAGTWKDLTDSVNSMAGNLTAQVRNIAQVSTAVANGDLSKKITVDVQGEILELKITINTMVDQLNAFAREVTRVAREVGTEGKLGGQADVKGVAGTWKELTDSVNSMAGNLTAQVRNIAQVTTAVANGDLSKKITVPVQGEILELKNTINTLVDKLGTFASEVTRVAREVGTEGKLGGQAEVKGVAGTWKDLTDNVNSMAGNLTSQVRNIAQVTTAVARGDLSKKITVDAQGEILELKNTVNTMVDQLNAFASEVTRVAREVGTEGALGGQADVRGVAGTWKELTDSVNYMAGNLTAQVRNIAEVTTAVARGDLSKKITVDVRGEIAELKGTINTMVDQLNAFASEVTRVAREVGTDGKLGGQAEVKGVAGTWKELTDSVNSMAQNLTAQVRNIAQVTTAVATGDLSKKITVAAEGEILELKNTINTMVDQLNGFASEVTRVAREVGTEGKLGGQAVVKGVAGTWKELTDSVNSMAQNLTSQVRNIAQVTTAVAWGDLSKKITVPVQGEILELKNTINTMVDQLNAFASEVTRVAREVGTEGKLGGQAVVKGVAGTWKDLTDNVNTMASNLTTQVRGIARVVTAVANGDLRRKLAVEAKGEVAALADTINTMTDTLAVFADQVTAVAREVGIEGKLGGQARVPGAAGIWRDLTDNVNQLAQNLTTQVRAIAAVATAVTNGDLTQSIAVEASGEVAALKDNINAMIKNLRDTTRKNMEQDWLKTNLARFGRTLQGQRDLRTLARITLSNVAPLVSAHHAAFYVIQAGADGPLLHLLASYAHHRGAKAEFHLGEGLVGQAALEKQRILLTDLPAEYVPVVSGLGEAPPKALVILPVVFEDRVKAVIELASLRPFSDVQLTLLEQLAESIGIVVHTVEGNNRTEALLRQSQALTEELQGRQAELTKANQQLEDQTRSLQASQELLKKQREELKTTNLALEEKAVLLAEQKAEVERKKLEVEQAKRALEEKAEQLALTSRYKSEFLANMSHELRTPLNSMLILSQILAENPDGNLQEKQVEFARTIQAAGKDLLDLIGDILDLSKIESGTVELDLTEVSFAEIRAFTERTFRLLAESKGLTFNIAVSPELPTGMFTDAKRLQQVLRNLLANAFKFTESGTIELILEPGPREMAVTGADEVIGFHVRDTGIGIPEEKHSIIFEAFQQADGTTSRKYGGTGLGLSISREIAQLLGGQIRLQSSPGQGSTFTLYLPRTCRPRPTRPAPTPARVPDGNGNGNGSHTAPPPASSPVTRAEVASAGDDCPTLLIVEADADFAGTLLDLAHESGFKGLVATRGEAALSLARERAPEAITLDLDLPDIDGWTVLEQLKADPRTRHIPVQVICSHGPSPRALRLGALGALAKPSPRELLVETLADTRRFLERPIKGLLVVEDDQVQRTAISELVGGPDVDVVCVGTGAAALEALRSRPFDCVILDLRLPDISGLELAERAQAQQEGRPLPIIIYTGKVLSPAERARLEAVSESIVLKSADGPDRLQEEVGLFLHRPGRRKPRPRPEGTENPGEPDGLIGARVLIVDDDPRNLFALTSVLDRHQVEVLRAENGRRAIELLAAQPDIDLVLMDVMMPEMDGYETIRAIRKDERFVALPIIAVTAKAMRDDRAKALSAGASDYITKPIETERLLSILRSWTS